MKKLLIIAALMFPLIVGCENESQPEGPVAVTGVRITPDAVTLTPHQECEFEVVVLPENATNKNYTWSYDDTNFEAVEGKKNTFRVLYYDTEKITLTVTTEDGGFTAESEITIGDMVSPESISLSEPVEMTVGQTQTLSYKITPDDACQCEEEISWSYTPYLLKSDPDCVISVNEITGEILAVNPGTATITVETINGGYTASKTIVVKAGKLTPEKAFAWAGSQVQVNSSAEVEKWEVEEPEDYQISNGKLEISQSGLLTLPLFESKYSDYPANAAVTVKATLKDGSVEKCFVASRGWLPAFYTNSSDETPAATFEAGKDAYLRVLDNEGYLTYGEFMWVQVVYADGSGVANSINRPSSTNTYRAVQVRAGDYGNYNVSVLNGEVKFDFDLTPSN